MSQDHGGPAYQWIRSNILGLVAIFIALSGSAVAAQVASQPDAQKAAKKKKKAKRGPAGPQGPAGPATGVAGGDLTGSYPNPTIGLDAVGAAEIQNVTRSISLPIASFVNRSDQALLDFVASDGTSPDLEAPTSIEWDEDIPPSGGANVADIDFVESTLVIPPDYASGGSIALRVSKSGHSGVPERLGCFVNVDGTSGANVFATTTTDALTTYALTPVPAPPYAPGLPVAIACKVDDGAAGTTADEIVTLRGAEFRYTAIQ